MLLREIFCEFINVLNDVGGCQLEILSSLNLRSKTSKKYQNTKKRIEEIKIN